MIFWISSGIIRYLINQAIDAMKPGGILYFSTNFSRFQMQAEALSDCTVKDITRSTTPFDFRDKLNRFCFLIRKNELNPLNG